MCSTKQEEEANKKKNNTRVAMETGQSSENRNLESSSASASSDSAASRKRLSPVASAKVLGVHFNQSHSSFTVSTERGFMLYRTHPLEKISECDLGGGIAMAVQMYETNFFGLVGGGTNPAFPTCKFVFWDDFKQTAVTEEVLKDRILSVKINHEVIVLVTRKNAYIYSIKNMERLCKVKTANNPRGIGALSSSRGSYFLAPGVVPGDVVMTSYNTGVQRTFARCHEHPLQHIAINTTYEDEAEAHPRGDRMFATASEHGTLVKVFDVATGKKVQEFRRGGDAATIYNISFSSDMKCVAVTSLKGTVHVFSLSKDYGNVESRVSLLGGMMGYFSSQWSPFSIAFHNGESGEPESALRATPPHYACVTPLNAAPTSKYELVVVSETGSYAIHELNFQNTSSTELKRGTV